jgi:hypothetical protein
MIGLGKSLIDFLDAYGLRNKIITYVKDESLNLNTMTNVFKSIGKCESSSLEENFQGTYFGHDFSKTYYYATNNEKVCKDLKYVFYKVHLGKFMKMHHLAKNM